MKRLLLPAACLLAACAIVLFVNGCNTTQQRTVANTIEAVEASGTSSYAGYCDGVLKGLIPTNDFPKVSRIYNQFQSDVAVAVTLAQNNSNALAPTNLTAELGDLVNVITTASKLPNTKITPTP